MWKILAIFIITLNLFSCAIITRTTETSVEPSDFEQGQKFITFSDYEKAEPFLIKTLMREDQNYAQAAFFLGQVYDQTAQPEKAILNLREFFKFNTGTTLDLVKAKALLLKNLAKIKTPIENTEEKQFIARVITSKIEKPSRVFESLRSTLDFQCGVYCAEEVNYLQEIQLQLIYAIEADPELYKVISELLYARYDYFEAQLKQTALDLEFRKKIAVALYDALQKLKSSHLETNTLGSVKTAELINHLEASQKRVERWLYE